MKKKLMELLQKKEARKAELGGKLDATEDLIELRSIDTELTALNGEITELRSMIDKLPDEEPEQRGTTTMPVGGFTPLASYGTGVVQPKAEEKRGIDAILDMPNGSTEEKTEMRSALFASPEYREAYFKALSGKTMTDVETRALTTAANSGGAAVPTTTYNMIITRMTQTSALFGLINKSFIPGNVVLPVANAQTSAEWSDTAPSSDQDDTLSSVSLGVYALSKFAKVKGQLILMAIDALEQYVVKAISDQLAIAVENAIINGDGSAKPTGILTGVTWTSKGNSDTFSSVVGYDDLVNAKKMLGLYRTNAVWVMNATMEAQIYKIKTTTNQPLFTQNPITGLISDPLGFPIVVDYYMPDDTVLLMNPEYYFMNISQDATITSDDSAGFLSTSRVFRGTMNLDAKPALSEAFVKLTKATA